SSPRVKSSAACLGELEVPVCGLEFGVVGEPKLSSALKLTKHVRDLVDRFWGVTNTTEVYIPPRYQRLVGRLERPKCGTRVGLGRLYVRLGVSNAPRLFKKRKGKEVASNSEGVRFKTPYHEAHFNSKLSARKILPELIIKVDENILNPCAFQIENRKWERLTNPIQAVGQNMVREFYANA
ncbi:hypothetical protein PIB30_092533, partial [Stylosanthes scabra]|nr:hypothetical protein [Stylosanthes scabra]